MKKDRRKLKDNEIYAALEMTTEDIPLSKIAQILGVHRVTITNLLNSDREDVVRIKQQFREDNKITNKYLERV